MRSIYTLVSHAISDLPYLKPAVALVLGFVGGKMFAEFFHYEIGVGISLLVVSAFCFLLLTPRPSSCLSPPLCVSSMQAPNFSTGTACVMFWNSTPPLHPF